MAEIVIAAVLLLAAVIIMGIKIYILKRDIYTFSERLERCLDAIVSDESIEALADSGGDTLWSKTYDKLAQIYTVWRRRSEDNLEEKKKIKALISDISHQTKTPIANMKIYLEIMQEEEPISEKEKEFLLRMEEQTDKLDFLLHSMVKMSRLETGIIEIHKQSTGLYETIGLAMAAVVPKAEKKNIGLHVHCDEKLQVSHDRKWTEEAIFNILDNAVKYTGEGGNVHICVSVQDIFTKISIKDTGKGILPERQAEIFTRFYREPEVAEQEGIGVGLYLARKIVTLQNGYIEVHSVPGAGSDFQIYLPGGGLTGEE